MVPAGGGAAARGRGGRVRRRHRGRVGRRQPAGRRRGRRRPADLRQPRQRAGAQHLQLVGLHRRPHHPAVPGPGQHPGQLRRLLLQRGPAGQDEGRPHQLRHHRPDQPVRSHLPEAGSDRAAAPGPDPQPDQPRPGVRRDRLRLRQPLHRPLAVGHDRHRLQPGQGPGRQARLLVGGVRAGPGGPGPGDAAPRGHRPDRLRAHLPRQEPQLHRGRRPGRGRQAGAVGQAQAEGLHHRHLHRRAGRRRDLGRPGLERRRVPGSGPEPGRQLRHPQGGLAALRRRHGHPQGRAPSRQRRPLHELRAPSQGAGPDLQVRQLRHPGVAGQAPAAHRPDGRPVDLPTGLDQAVDHDPHRPEAPEVAAFLA